jgi:uncharacterized protein (DUF2384 family)
MRNEDSDTQSTAPSEVSIAADTRREIAQLLRVTFSTSADARRWWTSPHVMLDGFTPAATVKRVNGAVRVRDMLVVIHYGGVA